MTDTDKTFCSILFDVLCEKGVKDVVCSPGSRNAPLLIAAAAREEMCKHVVTDERCAAFMALGMALVSKKPVALVCTSGTALLNYAPAVAEAFYQGVPLVVISADRPEQWIDQDDSQTLRQFEALSNFVKKSYELPAWGGEDNEMKWYANRISNDAIIEATSPRKGPVHINVRLGEPLGKKVNRDYVSPRLIEMISSDFIANKETIKTLGRIVSQKKVMLVAGFMPPDAKLHKSVAVFCNLPNVVAMTETLSNLHLGDGACDVDAVLTAYSEKELDDLAPELVISLGGSLVSRKLKEFLRRNRQRCEHWSLGWNHTTADCFMSLTKRIEVNPSRFLYQIAQAALRNQVEKTGCGVKDYSRDWAELRKKAALAKGDYVRSLPWCEMKAFRMLAEYCGIEGNLFLSNGTAVRYAQILNSPLPHASYCNRGVSGIDGSVSTAVGAAKVTKGKTFLITGDLSMAYDVGALALPSIPDTMKIVVIDNCGGGIFRFIPSTSALEEREKYFCAAPNLPLRNLAQGYEWNYFEACDEDSFGRVFPEFLMSQKKSIFRVICDGEKSAEILKKYMDVKTSL